jgi:hypothetical protein
MIFTVTRPDGSTEYRRHVPFNIIPDGARWKAVHAGNGQLLGRFDTAELAEQCMLCTTEKVPHFKPV